ncbi:MAG: hypothetical protein ACK5MR_07315 [Cumulibacter sp.]
MRARTALPARIVDLAASRHGVITRADLLVAGLSARVIQRLVGPWRRLAPGTYVLPGEYDPWLQKLHAGLLLAGEGSGAWGATALALWGLGDRTKRIEILTRKRRTSRLPWLTFRRDDLQQRRIVDVAPVRVCLEDAVVDAAAEGTRHGAHAIVARALQERRTTPNRLLHTVRARAKLRHRTLLCTAIGDSAAGAHSALEHLYLRDVQRAHALPPMQRQYVVPESGHHADGAYVAQRYLIELDGVRFHDRAADEAIDIAHGQYGYETARLSWIAIDGNPCAVARLIAAKLRFAELTPCPRCRTGG